jgi:hypothetical protein
VKPILKTDPLRLPLKEKLDLTAGYSRLMLEMPDIVARTFHTRSRQG